MASMPPAFLVSSVWYLGAGDELFFRLNQSGLLQLGQMAG
jgi:hypothetical protein